MKRYLITGASGFLGHHLTQELGRHQAAFHAPVALVRRGGSAPVGTQEVVADLAFWHEAASPVARGAVDGIFHLAAEVRHSRRHTEAMERFNVESTLTLVRLAARHRCRLVFVSTSGVVGVNRDPNARPTEIAPYCDYIIKRWPYYRSKMRAEVEARALAQQLGVDFVVLRPPALFGPTDPKLRALGLPLKFLRGQLPFVLSGGMHFADVRDVAEVLISAMQHRAPEPIYHLPGSAMSLVSFFAALSQHASGRPRVPRVLAPSLASLLASGSDGLFRGILRQEHGPIPDPVVIEMGSYYWGLGGTRAARDLNYLARPKEQTFADTVIYLRDHFLSAKR